MKTSKLREIIRETIKEMNEDNFDSRFKSFMDKNTGKGSFEKATTPQMPEATKVWDALVKTFSDNTNDSLSYLDSSNSYRSYAIQAIFRAMNV